MPFLVMINLTFLDSLMFFYVNVTWCDRGISFCFKQKLINNQLNHHFNSFKANTS